MLKSCMKSSLKLLNCTMVLGGVLLITYGVLMIRALEIGEDGSSSKNLAFPWLFHALLGVGIALCAITTLGYLAANTSNLLWLSCYITVLLLMLILETVIAACVFMNPKWEKELPSGKFVEFKNFVKANDDICRWASCIIFLIQGICVLLATTLRTRTLRTRETINEDDIDENEEYLNSRTPLIWRPIRSYSIAQILGRTSRFMEDDPNIV